MEFSERLKTLHISVAEIEAIGYSRRTAYAWLKGTRQPKEQMQNLIIGLLLKGRKKEK
jgi:hypothetical protein